MKKNLLRNAALAFAMLLTAGVGHAADLVQKNAYAYDIRVNSGDKYNPTVTYKLNGTASKVTIQPMVNGVAVGTATTGTTNQTNSVKVAVPAEADGVVTFNVSVTTAKTVTTPTLIQDKNTTTGKYQFYAPFGVTVNNCTDANTFGQILVTEDRNHSKVYGTSALNKYMSATTANGRGGGMIYAFDPQMQPIANAAAGGKYGFNAGLSINGTEVNGDYHRIKYSEDGRLFFCSGDPNRQGLYELDPDNLNAAATPLLNKGQLVWGFDVLGSGADTKLIIFSNTSYMADKTVAINYYELGNSKTLPSPVFQSAVSGTTAGGAGKYSWVNDMTFNIAFDPDGKGFHMGQYRGSPTSTCPQYVHAAINGGADVVDITSKNNGAGIAYNHDRTLFAKQETAANVTIYEVTKNNGGTIPTYKKLYTIALGIGNAINAIAFDYANNLYAVSNSLEWVVSYQLPHRSNGVVTVPAPSSQAYTVTPIVPTSVTLSQTQLELPVSFTETLTATIAPANAANKTITWSSDNEDVATVADGVVTAVAPGTATITASAFNGVKATCAVTVTALGLKTLYLAGDCQGWNPAEAIELPIVDGKYVYTLDAKGGKGFKISTVQGDWNVFNSGVLGASNDTYVLTAGQPVTLEAGKAGNLEAPSFGVWNLTIDENYALTITGPVMPEAIYVRGDANNWAADANYALKPSFNLDAPVANANGEYEYTLSIADVFGGNFKLGGQSWDDFNYGAQGEDPVVEAGKTSQAWAGSDVNFTLNGKRYTGVKMTFFYNPATAKASWLKFEGKEYITTDKAAFAYDVRHEPLPDNRGYRIMFKSTGDAAFAELVLTKVGESSWKAPAKAGVADAENAQVINMGAVTQGENSFDLESYNLPDDGKYNWSVRIHNHVIPEPVISKPVSVGGGRAGLAVFVDPEYPEVLGKVVIARTQNGGFDIYDAEGTLEAEKLHSGCQVLSASGTANNSSPMDGKPRKTEIVVASWGDTSYGVVAFDITTPDVAPYSVFEGVKEASGKVMNGDIAVGSGTPCVAFSGTGDATRMYTFDEDIFTNELAYNVIGTENTVGTALITTGLYGRSNNGTFGNTNVGLWGTENGVFGTQIAGNGMLSGVVGLCYYDNDAKALTWKASDMASVDPQFLPSATAGVCVNPAGNLLAVATYTGFEIYNLSWGEKDGKRVPVLEKQQTIASPYATGNRTNIQFDLANNLHVTNQVNGYYTVALANDEPIAETAAQPARYTLDIATGVNNIAVDEENEATPVYYNLNGVRVNADNLTPGIYVKVVGKTTTKVVVK